MPASSVLKICGLALALLAGPAAVATAAAATELVMVEERGCGFCARWNAEIAPAYPNTAEGRFAPLRRVELGDIPDDLALKSRPVFTPTFILVEDGEELGRIEGYAGDEFFWVVLAALMESEAGFDPGTE